MKVEVLRYPSEVDWLRCKQLALNTVWLKSTKVPDENWRYDILASGHSPIRTLPFTVRLEIPYWVSVHLVRHKIGVEHYVSSQRNDRQEKYDRTKAPQDATVIHIMDMNAEAVINISHRRLCKQASKETREAWQAVCREISAVCPWIAPHMVPMCKFRGGVCEEFFPCGGGDGD